MMRADWDAARWEWIARRWGWPLLLTRLREGKGMDTLRRWPEEGRQDSLRRSLDLSYAVLDDKARGLLMELTKLVPGPMFTTTDLGTAGARWNMEQWEWEDALQQLVDAALVQMVGVGQRYRLHPAVAEYVTGGGLHARLPGPSEWFCGLAIEGVK